MSYTITVHHADGTLSHKRFDSRFPMCPPVTSQSADDRKADISSDLRQTREGLRNARGYDRKKSMRMVARIPQEVYNHVLRNEGREAASDARHLIRRSRELGIDPVVSKGRF